jgi:O-acetylserine/cysteine efflux transporter
LKPKHVAAAILVTFIWGANFVALKIGLRTFPPIFFTLLRFCCVIFPAILFIRRGTTPWSLILSVGLVLGVAHYVFLMLGLAFGMPGGLSSLVLQTQAGFTLGLSAVVLRDPPGFRLKLGLGIALVGLAVIALGVGHSTILGFVFILCSALAWAVSNILVKRAGHVDTLRLVVWMGIVPFVPLVCLSLKMEQVNWPALAHLGWKPYMTAVYSGLLSTLVAFAIWGRLLRTYSPNAIAPFSLLVPIFGMVLCWIFLGERLSASKIAGALIVFCGLLAIITEKKQAPTINVV